MPKAIASWVSKRPPIYFWREAASLASLDKRKDAGEMKQPDALDASRFTDGHGTDEAFCRPFVELRACAAGIKLMPELWRSYPHRQIAFPVADKLCGAGLCRTVAISNHARAGWRAGGTLKVIFTGHTSDLLFIAIEDSTRSRTGASCNLYTKWREGLWA